MGQSGNNYSNMGIIISVVILLFSALAVPATSGNMASPEPDAVIYEDDFDGEVDGTSPPINWVIQDADICEVDDDGFEKSAPNSMKFVVSTGGVLWAHTDQNIGENNITFWMYINDLNPYWYLCGQETAGNWDSTKSGFFVASRAPTDIKWNDGAWQDTSVDVTAGWHEVWIISNITADTFDFWWDSVLIINGGAYYLGNTLTDIQSFQVGGSSTGGAITLWIDDIVIGEASGGTPEINNVTDTPDPAEYGGNVNVTADVTDVVAVDEVWLNITNPDSTFTNTSMNAGVGDEYYLNTTYSQLGLHDYFIWANDTSNNDNMSATFNFTIQDTTPPEINDVLDVPDPQDYGLNVNISGDITDDVAIFGAWVNVTFPNTTYQNSSMIQGAGDARYFNTTYSAVGLHNYTIWSNDTLNNWNSSAQSSFTIEDNVAPEIANVTATPDPQEVFGFVNITANITDVSTIDNSTVLIAIYAPPVFFAVTNFTMTQGPGDIWFYNASYNVPNTYQFKVWANDTFNNENISEWFFFNITDTIPPEFNNLTVNPSLAFRSERTNISVNVTDNYLVDTAWVNVTFPDGSTQNYSMINGSGDIYYLNRTFLNLGIYQFRIDANDTENNWNSSARSSFRIKIDEPFLSLGGDGLPSMEAAVNVTNITEPGFWAIVCGGANFAIGAGALIILLVVVYIVRRGS